jgi:hypothetical protein
MKTDGVSNLLFGLVLVEGCLAFFFSYVLVLLVLYSAPRDRFGPYLVGFGIVGVALLVTSLVADCRGRLRPGAWRRGPR